MTTLSWLLIVTAIYLGSMAPGVPVDLRIEARDLSFAKCRSVGDTVARKLSWTGATDIEIKCVAMGR